MAPPLFATSHQGHIKAAEFVGCIYYWGQGVAVNYPRAMAAYKVGAEGGDATSQWMVGAMYCYGRDVDVDYAQALPWIEKAAAQHDPTAVGQLGTMYCEGQGVTPSYRCGREYYARAIELGSTNAVENMQILTKAIQNVTSRRNDHSAPSQLLRDLMLSRLAPHTRRSPPS